MTTPSTIPLDQPTPGTSPRRYDYDHIPKLGPHRPGDRQGSLLPLEGGRAGLVYLQVPVGYARQAEAAGWKPMANSVRYTIVGPKGTIDMELMATGVEIPGIPASGVKCACLQAVLIHTDPSSGEETRVNLIEEATGLDPTTGFPPDSPQEDPTHGPKEIILTQEADPGEQDRGEPSDSGSEDPQGEARGPEPDSESGRGQGKGNSRKSKA